MPTPYESRLLPPLFASLTLGLAPFLPEPHVIGKLRWVAGGAHGMAVIDWLDFGFHGLPWLWLGWTLWDLFRHRSST